MRILLIIPMAVIELILLLVGFVLALINTEIAERWASFWVKHLPDIDWYFHKNKTTPKL